MKNKKNKVKNTKDKIEGKIMEAAGELTGNEQLELKGKLLVAKSDIKTKMDMRDKVNDVKEGVAKKINDALDKDAEKEKDRKKDKKKS